MNEPIVIPPGGGEVIGDSAERRVEILSDDPALHATWSRFGPRRDGADLHVHRRHTDIFYVLEGELTVRLGLEDELVSVPQGGYFVNADIAPLGADDAREWCRALPARAGVVAIPTSAFYDDPAAGRTLVRFAFCKRPQVIEEAVRRLVASV